MGLFQKINSELINSNVSDDLKDVNGFGFLLLTGPVCWCTVMKG